MGVKIHNQYNLDRIESTCHHLILHPSKFFQRIISERLLNYIPELRIELIDLDDELKTLFKKKPAEFLKKIQKGLYNVITFDLEIKKIFEK